MSPPPYSSIESTLPLSAPPAAVVLPNESPTATPDLSSSKFKGLQSSNWGKKFRFGLNYWVWFGSISSGLHPREEKKSRVRFGAQTQPATRSNPLNFELEFSPVDPTRPVKSSRPIKGNLIFWSMFLVWFKLFSKQASSTHTQHLLQLFHSFCT